RAVEHERTLDRVLRRLLPRDDLDERQQVDRVEGMTDEKPLGVRQACLETGWQQPRRRRADEGVRSCTLVDLREQAALELLVLRGALLDHVGIADRVRE